MLAWLLAQWLHDPAHNELLGRLAADRTLATPHLGSPYARWFAYFQRNSTLADKEANAPPEVQRHANWQAGYRDWDASEFVNLKRYVREHENLGPSFFTDGDAVDALQPGSAFLAALNAATPSTALVDYYFLWGNAPLLPLDQAENASWWNSWATGGANEVMWDSFLAHVSRGQTDGVVPAEGAQGKSWEGVALSFQPNATVLVDGANHVNITTKGIDAVLQALTGRLDSGRTALLAVGNLALPADGSGDVPPLSAR